MFTYVRKDFIDGLNMYGAALLYKRFRQRQQVWKFGLNPEDVAGFVGEYGWRLVEQAGPGLLRAQLHPAGGPGSRRLRSGVVGLCDQNLAVP